MKIEDVKQEFDRLNSRATSTFDRLRHKYRISPAEEVPDLDRFIQADKSAREARATRTKGRKRGFDIRY